VIACPDLEGLEWMKRTMWSLTVSLNPMDDTYTNHTTLVGRYEDPYWRILLRRKLQGRFLGRSVDAETVRSYVLIETIYPYDHELIDRMVENRFIKNVIGPEGTVRYRFPLGKG
jgi:hypothetical protein